MMKLSFELYRSGAFGFKPENVIVLSRALFLQLPSNTQKMSSSRSCLKMKLANCCLQI